MLLLLLLLCQWKTQGALLAVGWPLAPASPLLLLLLLLGSLAATGWHKTLAQDAGAGDTLAYAAAAAVTKQVPG